MRVYGRIQKLNVKNRIIGVIVDGKLVYIHMTNKVLKEFKPYLTKKTYVILEATDEKVVIENIACLTLDYFIKIMVPSGKYTKVYFDINDIKNEIKSLVNSLDYKMFLDLEFSWPRPYSHMPAEIVQYGYLIEDKDGKVVEEGASLVRPLRNTSLNKGTLDFLHHEYSDFDNACPYIEFYQLMERLIDKYDPKIIAWGRNDVITLEKSFKINHLHPLDIRRRYLNLMQVMKNYYNYKKEMGLFATYQELTGGEEQEQAHDAYEDAKIAKDIFDIFKDRINKDENL